MSVRKGIIGRYWPFFLLVGITGFIRFYNLNWDLGHAFHIDEVNLSSAVARVALFRQFDPEFYAYGVFPIYLYRSVAEIMVRVTENALWTADIGQINLIGRVISAATSTASVVMMHVLAGRILDRRFAYLTAWFFALSPLSVQHAHFAVTESMLILFLVLILHFSEELKGSLHYSTLLTVGVLTGMAVATKVVAVSYLLIPFSVLIIGLIQDRHEPFLLRLRKTLGHGFYMTVAAVLTYLIFSPIVLINLPKFLEWFSFESAVVWGTSEIEYTRQFASTVPYLYQLIQLPYTFGIVPSFFAVIGFLHVLIQVPRKTGRYFHLLLFPAVYFSIVGHWEAKFVRYMLPLFPFLCLWAGLGMQAVFSSKPLARPRLSRFSLTLACLVTVIQGYSFFAPYMSEHTRITALSWIQRNIPRESSVLIDDFALINGSYDTEGNPFFLAGDIPVTLDTDTPEAKMFLEQTVFVADVIVIGTKRRWKVALDHPTEYPGLSQFYTDLFNGKLGFSLAATFPPARTVLGLPHINIPYDTLEETFSVFDRPTVLVFLRNPSGMATQ